MKGIIYGTYSEESDITFLMRDTFKEDGNFESIEVLGFVFGYEDNTELLLRDAGLKAEF